MNKWELVYDELKSLIEQGVSYEKIGKKFGCTGANIKKQAKILGIKLKRRRKINEKETFNRGVVKRHCENCGRPLIKHQKKYCSIDCWIESMYKKHISEWLNGKRSGSDEYGNIKDYVKRYILEKNNYCCEVCGQNYVNPYTGKSVLQIHHIDGDCLNNKEENLQLLCPTHHAMTENFGRKNKKSSGRKYKHNKK